MIKTLLLSLLVALCVSSCGVHEKLEDLAPVPSATLEGQATALVVLTDVRRASDVHIIGPDEVAVSGPIFTFHSPWEAWRPRQYRVPVGVVRFTLQDGTARTKRAQRLGFQAVAGELYEVTYDPAVGVAVEEIGSGKIARGKVKRRPFVPEAL